MISAIRRELTAENQKLSEEEKKKGELFELGDRRWKKIAHILKASAFLNGRNEVDLMDCQLIEYCIWDTEWQQKKAREVVEKCIQQNGLNCDTAIEDINDQIEAFKKKIDDFWFETITDPETDKIVQVNGEDCYECTRTGTRTIWYVGVNQTAGYSYYHNRNSHNVYNSHKAYHDCSEFTKNGDDISCQYKFHVNKNPGAQHKEKKTFESITQSTLQKNFDIQHYAPIIDKIHNEIKTLKEKKRNAAAPFSANLFADQTYNSVITERIDEAIHALEKALIETKKQHEIYFKLGLRPKLKVGDLILSNDIIFSADELEKMPEEEKHKAIAVICFVDNKKSYAMGLSEKKMMWKELDAFAGQYGKDLPKVYSQNWFVPANEMLQAIYKNNEKINKALETIGKEILTAQKYWSSTPAAEDSDSAAMYISFDKGELDHTTKSHQYAARAVREWEIK